MGTIVNIALREDASPEDRLRAMFQMKKDRKPSCNIPMSSCRQVYMFSNIFRTENEPERIREQPP